ncbi:MAG: CBS domain-containing protein, partial [Spirochaetales bacterium]|nr:CBS domain-containing protein [Spirochaetales bacterium]
TPHDFVEILTAQDVSLIKILTVEDILTPGYPTIHPQQTIRELTDLFYTQRLTYAPVVDDHAHLVGEISLADVLKAGFPDYATQMGDLKFLRTFEPLERLVEHEEKLLVQEMMKPVSFGCSLSASVVEVTFEFLQKGRRHCPVLQGRQLVGVLSIMDILSKVIRG